MSAEWIVGVDIGGTFTDVVAVRAGDGEVRTAKVRSVTADPVESVESAFAAVGLDWAEVSDLVHGTTMATNAIVEGRLAPVALLATAGFADTLEIGRQNRRELYRLATPPKLPALVPEERRLEVRERVVAGGTVLEPLEPGEIERLAAAVAGLGVEAAAVVLLHSYAHPEHEERLAARLAEVVGHVVCSHRVNPEPREYERSNSAVLNAALMPLAAGYLERLERRAGQATRVHLFHSAGGMTSLAAARERPLALALSGPAAGVSAAAGVAASLGLEAVIGFDMGGTTTDASIVLEGRVQIGSDQRLAGRPVRQLMVAVESIGAGGGSIARLEGGAVRVGPDSAGADPGPACYGRGGEQPTVTDANLVLGYLNPARVLGGSVALDPERAAAAVGRIAAGVGVGLEEAALGIHRVANATMARALRRVTVERGVDARGCVLLAFGGAGPMHAVALAREFGIERIVVPAQSSVFSALGCLTAERRYAEQRAVHVASRRWEPERLAAVLAAMCERVAAPLRAAGVAEEALAIERLALVRYAGQSDTVEVPLEVPLEREALGEAFRTRHRRIYGFATAEPWEIDSLRVTASGPPACGLGELAPEPARGAPTPIAVARCWFDAGGARDTPRLERASLAPGVEVAGPCIVEDAWSTVVVDPGSRVAADRAGHLHVTVGEAP